MGGPKRPCIRMDVQCALVRLRFKVNFPNVARVETSGGFTLKSLLSQAADQLDPKQFSLPNKSMIQALVTGCIPFSLDSSQANVQFESFLLISGKDLT